MVCHKCDNPRCVRPSHLFLGSASENLADMRVKGRGAAGARHPQAKLDDDKVIRIRKRYAEGGVTQRDLAKEFGVYQTVISKILLGKIWRFS